MDDLGHQTKLSLLIPLIKKSNMDTYKPISTIMSTELITVSESDTLSQIDRIFRTKRIHHIPVLKNEELVGIISKSDFQFFRRAGVGTQENTARYESLRLKMHTAADIMTTGIATLKSSDKIAVALEVFKENLFHSIPIVDDGKLVGLVTTYDMLLLLERPVLAKAS